MAMNVVNIPPLNTAVRRKGQTATNSGATAVVAAEAGRRIRVLGMIVVSTTANSIKLQSDTTDITGLFPLAANGGFTLPFNEHGWCETASGEALNINMSAATSTGLQIVYMVV